jgi:hypothetical protein
MRKIPNLPLYRYLALKRLCSLYFIPIILRNTVQGKPLKNTGKAHWGVGNNLYSTVICQTAKILGNPGNSEGNTRPSLQVGRIR